MRKMTAGLLAAALILLSPGTGVYQALANGFAVNAAAKAAPGSAGAAAGAVAIPGADIGGAVELNARLIPIQSSVLPQIEQPNFELGGLQDVNISPELLPTITPKDLAADFASQSAFTLEQFRNSQHNSMTEAAPAFAPSVEGVLRTAAHSLRQASDDGVAASFAVGRRMFDASVIGEDFGASAVEADFAGRRESSGLRHTQAAAEKKSRAIPIPKAAAFAAALTPTAAFAAAGSAAEAAAGWTLQSVMASAAHFVPILPAAYAYMQWRRAVKAEKAAGIAPEKASPSTRFWETAETGITLLGPVIGSFVIAGVVAHSILMPAALAAMWFFGTQLALHQLADLRAQVVGGWQASHDQRYRVGRDGQLHDVRGRKYGEDRYEQYAPGKVRSGERFAMRLAASALGLLWLTSTGLIGLLAYNAALAGLFMVEDYVISRRGPPPAKPIDAESAAHASRFSRSQ
ncbi:MAG: hypothetical protein ABIJ96_10480 [Elusimicrobiota bacterium]